VSKIGFIGLGRMGKGMASNLQRKGFGLMVLASTPRRWPSWWRWARRPRQT
jgi:3-hydroxyisobutyrate dehydrogenase-like beta-hydroxyacid dehydrogenase